MRILIFNNANLLNTFLEYSKYTGRFKGLCRKQKSFYVNDATKSHYYHGEITNWVIYTNFHSVKFTEKRKNLLKNNNAHFVVVGKHFNDIIEVSKGDSPCLPAPHGANQCNFRLYAESIGKAFENEKFDLGFSNKSEAVYLKIRDISASWEDYASYQFKIRIACHQNAEAKASSDLEINPLKTTVNEAVELISSFIQDCDFKRFAENLEFSLEEQEEVEKNYFVKSKRKF